MHVYWSLYAKRLEANDFEAEQFSNHSGNENTVEKGKFVECLT